MKHLSLIRHAKSSWKDAGLTDFERPLNKRGRGDLPTMARRLAAAEPRPDRMVASPARRAEQTARALAEALGPIDLVFLPSLYGASTHTLFLVLSEQDDVFAHVALVGHNPGITDLVELLAGAGIANVPTCGLVRLELPIDSWAELAAGSARLLAFETPKDGSA